MFWLVLKLEISYRVVIFWRILVYFREFFEDYIFAMVKYLSFHNSSSFALRHFFYGQTYIQIIGLSLEYVVVWTLFFKQNWKLWFTYQIWVFEKFTSRWIHIPSMITDGYMPLIRRTAHRWFEPSGVPISPRSKKQETLNIPYHWRLLWNATPNPPPPPSPPNCNKIGSQV